MQGLGVHTSMWTMLWDRSGAERAIAEAVRHGMDFIEIALLNPDVVDAAHTRALLARHGLRMVTSLGLPEHAWASRNPEVAVAHLTRVIDLTADMGGEAVTGVTYGGIGERTGLCPPFRASWTMSPARCRARPRLRARVIFCWGSSRSTDMNCI